jgi:hypothetical protein
MNNKVGRPFGSGNNNICYPCQVAPYYWVRSKNTKEFYSEKLRFCNSCLKFGIDNNMIAEYRKVTK